MTEDTLEHRKNTGTKSVDDFRLGELIITLDDGSVLTLVPTATASRDDLAKLDGKKVDDLLSNDKVRAKVKEELDKLSSEFKGYERIRNFALISEDFTQENGMLTPKLSLKRRNVMQKWGGELEKLYK